MAQRDEQAGHLGGSDTGQLGRQAPLLLPLAVAVSGVAGWKLHPGGGNGRSYGHSLLKKQNDRTSKKTTAGYCAFRHLVRLVPDLPEGHAGLVRLSGDAVCLYGDGHLGYIHHVGSARAVHVSKSSTTGMRRRLALCHTPSADWPVLP